MNGLDIYRDDEHIARLDFTRGGRVSLEYVDRAAMPISLSLPNDGTELDHRIIQSYFDGLLPDSAQIREHWAALFSTERKRVSAVNPFALLHHMGRDVAGDLQIVPSGEKPISEAAFARVGTEEIAARLRSMVRGETAGARAHLDSPSAVGRFSLAGAQSKFALTSFDDGATWYEPEGAFPSTHILKPPIIEFESQDLIEHISLDAARRVGLNTSHSEHRTFADASAIVSTRFDRSLHDGDIRRIHQEDLCQALGLHPSKKYEKDGGPTAANIIRLLQERTAEADVDEYVRSLAFSWAIANTDNHAKNYSLLRSDTGGHALAPLYDVCSFFPWVHGPASRDPMTGRVYGRPELAVKIGGSAVIDVIGGSHWIALAETVNLDPERVLDMARDILDRTPDAVADAASHSSATSSRLVSEMVERVQTHVTRAHERLGT